MKLITDVLRDIRKGRAVEIASLKLAEVVQAVDATGNKGEVIIKLTVKPEKGGGSQKIIDCKVTAKLPLEDIPEAIFFSDRDGDLHRSDPDQRTMFDEAPKADAGPGIPAGVAKN
jgi:hypothetical protein